MSISMNHKKSMSILEEILSVNDINSVLELGSGIHSTPIISKYLDEKNGKLISLEEDGGWHSKVLEHEDCKITENSSQKLILCHVIASEDGEIKYSYNIDGSEKFDLIFIDGPSAKWAGEKYRFKNIEWQNIYKTPKSGYYIPGHQSTSLLDYVLPACHDNTIILLDGRIASVVYYVYKHSDKFEFEFRGIHSNRHDIFGGLKPEVREKIENSIQSFKKLNNCLSLVAKVSRPR